MHATRDRRTMTMVLVLGTILGMAVWAPRTGAADSRRAVKWQFSIPVTFTSSVSYGSEGATSIDINDDIGWGFTFGYNLNEHLMLGVDFTWIDANYDASVAADFDNDQVLDDLVTVSGTLDASNFQFVGQYNFMTKAFTPFLRASFGSTWIDSNIPSGPATGTCWWHPWYGYICDTWQPTFEDSAFSYGAAGGVRGELTPTFFLEGSYNLLWIDFDKAGTQSFDGIRLNMGWLF